MSTATTRTGGAAPDVARACTPATSATSGPLPGGSSSTAGSALWPGPTSRTGAHTAPRELGLRPAHARARATGEQQPGDHPADGIFSPVDDDEVRARFARARVARLATVDGQHRPHLVPVCFAFDGATIVTAVDAKPKTTT